MDPALQHIGIVVSTVLPTIMQKCLSEIVV